MEVFCVLSRRCNRRTRMDHDNSNDDHLYFYTPASKAQCSCLITNSSPKEQKLPFEHYDCHA